MPKKNYTNDELKEIIAEAKAELTEVLKSESVQAAPKENGGEMVKEEKPEESVSVPETSASSSSSESSSEGSASDSTEASPEAPVSEAAPVADPAAGSASGGGADVATLVQAYSQLAPADLQAHVAALQQVMQAQQPAPAAPSAPADPSGVPAPGPDASAPMPGEGSKPLDPASQMALKSEKELSDKLAKSQDEIAELKNKTETLVKAMELMLRKPERKSVTGKDLVKSVKEETVDVAKLSKSELTKKLSNLAKNPELKKSERNLINSFYNGEVKVEQLAVLFEKK